MLESMSDILFHGQDHQDLVSNSQWRLVEEIYTRNEGDEGLFKLHGMFDDDVKPMLLCSRSDGSVRVYELPTFMERGRIFAKDHVRAIEAGRAGPYFFTGDWTGLVTVWKWNKEEDDKALLQQQH